MSERYLLDTSAILALRAGSIKANYRLSVADVWIIACGWEEPKFCQIQRLKHASQIPS